MLIDALQCGTFDRAAFEDLRAGGVTCVTSTLGFWEGAIESLDNLSEWRDMARDLGDIMMIARNTDDILAAKTQNKVAVLLGYQNTNCLDGRIRYVELFAELGVRVLQLTYNNQNELGSSCYEENDSGLARFGREVISEMNKCGMLVDLSHVGDKTTLDAILHSEKPVAITHANPARALKHQRNKPDHVIKALAERGGVIGCAVYKNITPPDAYDSAGGFARLIAQTVDIAGIDHVGIGTDFIHRNSQAYLDWMRSGRWTRTVQYGAASAQNAAPSAMPDWLEKASGLAAVPEALGKVGFSAAEIGQLTHGNWLRLYRAAIG